jgi:S-adenosylmethionine hydrolase
VTNTRASIFRSVHRIALLTDFGTRDPYVAAMKGVIAARSDAPLFDLTHEIAPFDILEAAWFLRSVVRYWPEGTIFVCVVDPGVGTSRDIIAVEIGGRIFLAPDNGLLTFVCEATARRVTNETLFLPNGSTTFHGRDRFAPVAAALANGHALEDLGSAATDLVRLAYEAPTYDTDVVRGTIVAIDRFGNAITDIEAPRIPFPRFALHRGDVVIDRLERTYTGGGAFLIIGSSGTIEISVAAASAAERLQLRRLERVELRPLPV